MLEALVEAFKSTVKEALINPFKETAETKTVENPLQQSMNDIKNKSLEELKVENEASTRKIIEAKSTYSNEINVFIRTPSELKVYQEAGLKEATVNDRPVLIDTSIDLSIKDGMGRTNLERMEEGLPPLDKNGESYNLHHIGQKNDSPLAELTNEIHKKEYSTLHDTSIRESDIDRESFYKERSEHWKARAEEIKKQGSEVNV